MCVETLGGIGLSLHVYWAFWSWFLTLSVLFYPCTNQVFPAVLTNAIKKLVKEPVTVLVGDAQSRLMFCVFSPGLGPREAVLWFDWCLIRSFCALSDSFLSLH